MTWTLVPVVGTRYTGSFEVEILEVVPCELAVTRLIALAETGPPTQWIRRVEFREHEGGTLLTVTNVGVNSDDFNERILLRMMMQIQAGELENLTSLLEQRRRHGG